MVELSEYLRPSVKFFIKVRHFVTTVFDVSVLTGILISGRNMLCTTEAPASSEPIPAINVIVYCAAFPIVCFSTPSRQAMLLNNFNLADR